MSAYKTLVEEIARLADGAAELHDPSPLYIAASMRDAIKSGVWERDPAWAAADAACADIYAGYGDWAAESSLRAWPHASSKFSSL